MSSESNRSSENENKQVNSNATRDDIADPIDLVNQRLERQPTIDPEEVVNNPAISPETLDEGDNLRGDLTKE